MAEALKTFFSPALVRRLAADLTRAQPSFPERAFVKDATTGLEALELLDRGRHIARALAEHLPPEYPKALRVLLRSLGPKHATSELVGAGMAPFFYLPHTLFVAEHGLEHFELSLQAQYELTQRFTCEGSISAYIAKDPERTFRQFGVWSKDEDPHVRRLVSEGTRLRLPWAPRVSWLDENPDRVLALLEALKDDPASLVRRSVANNLNDLSKIYPDLTVDVCRRWAEGASGERAAMVSHALRSLVKRGHRGALEVLGVGARPRVEVTRFLPSPKVVRLGESLRFSFEIASTVGRSQALAVDYVVHFVKANGAQRAKVFKLKRVSLDGRASVELKGRISFSQMTTRTHYPGRHRVDALVNGVTYPLGEFEVRGA
jgi:3-methyladenine DNA glycosylase AlkC